VGIWEGQKRPFKLFLITPNTPTPQYPDAQFSDYQFSNSTSGIRSKLRFSNMWLFSVDLRFCSPSPTSLFKKLLVRKPFQKKLERKPFQKRFDRKRKTAQHLSLRTLIPNPIRRDHKPFLKRLDRKTAKSKTSVVGVINRRNGCGSTIAVQWLPQAN